MRPFGYFSGSNSGFNRDIPFVAAFADHTSEAIRMLELKMHIIYILKRQLKNYEEIHY